MNQTDEVKFWADVEHRRNLFFIAVAGWLVAGPAVFAAYFWITRGWFDIAAVAALLTWGAVCYRTSNRLTRMPCVRCKEKAFDHPYFFMKDAMCRSCGLQPPHVR